MSQPPSKPLPADELPTDVPTLQQMVRDLQAAVVTLQEQVRLLTEQQNRNSRNSSRPPSSDPRWRPRPQKPPTGRKRGGQPGHAGAHRPFQPPSAVDQGVVGVPPACQHCGQDFPATLPPRRKCRRHQVVGLPPIRPVVTEYQLVARCCPDCGKRTWATAPAGVSRRCVGPRVQALAALLAGACRISWR